MAHGVEVSFPDPGLEAAVREAIGQPVGEILDTDLAGLTYLSAFGRNVSDLTGIEYCTDVTNLLLGSNQLVNLEPLSGLTNLQSLTMEDNQISDITPLAGLVNLEYLWLKNNNIGSIAVLSGLSKLNQLMLHGNPLTDLSPLAGLISLKELWAGYEIGDLAPLAGLTNLTLLFVGYNVTDLTPLSGLTKLNYLYLERNLISDLTPLSNLNDLEWLILAENQITNIAPLSGLTKLKSLLLDLNSISELSPVMGLTNLETLGVAYNQVVSLSALAGLTNLRLLCLHGNNIVDLRPLRTTTGLTQLQIGMNDITDLTPLVENVGLDVGDKVWVAGNPLNPQTACWAVNELMSRGVLVDWTGDCTFNECTVIMSKISPALARWAMKNDELPSTIDSWDNGIPDMYEVALPVAALCNGDEELAGVFMLNRARILAAPAYQILLEDGWWFYWTEYADYFAALATMDSLCVAGLAEIGFEGLVSYEPVAPYGDFDSDAATNQEEYDNVIAWGGSERDYARAAMSPFTQGLTPMPAATLPALGGLVVSVLALGAALIKKRVL
ncbi:MAG TPA: leucine-rich repeat domain-containing protein [Candidatus Bathyarchaeia archaeon]|nr:leucine-rich repeat domain-containing protein [Candidatus Bathyarchaeia archaeon]